MRAEIRAELDEAAPIPGQPNSTSAEPPSWIARRVVAALGDLARAAEDPGAVLDLLARSATDLFPLQSALACELVDGTLVVRAAAGDAVAGPGALAPVGWPAYDGLTAPDPLTPVTAPADCSPGLVLPLRHSGRDLGALVVATTGPDALGTEHRDLLETLTEVAASALASASTLATHRSRSAAVVDAMGEGLVEIAADGLILFANRSAERMLRLDGTPARDLTIDRLEYELVGEDGRTLPLARCPALDTLRTGEPHTGVVVGVRSPDGQVTWLQVNTVPVRDGDTITSVISSFTDITERRQLAEARREDLSRLRAASELTGLAWWSLDLNTKEHEWSDEMFRLVGLEPGGRPPDLDGFLAMVHPEDRAIGTGPGTFGSYVGHRNVFRVVHPDGQVRHLQSWVAVDETDGDGSWTKVRGATIDVTERELAAAELDSNRSVLAAALELTQIATWRWDVQENQVTWSDGFRRILGLEDQRDDAVLRVEDFFAVLHPDDVPYMQALGDLQLASGRGEEAQYRVIRPDGSIRHVRALTDVRSRPDGTVVEMWGTAIDVTDSVLAAARLEASEEHFRVAFDHAPIGMAMFSLEGEDFGRVLRVNTTLLGMLGYREDEVVGQPLSHITHPDDVERDRRRFQRLASGELASVSYEKRYRRQDGTTLVAWLNAAVIHSRDGRPLYLVTHAIDLSERLQEQAQLKRLALTDTLTGLANRTLLVDRLDQALARLQRTDDACAMLLLDVDRFKLVNDSLGHLLGDALLVEIAGRITDVSRADATVARFGGDEFVVLVEDVHDLDDLHGIAQRILDTLRRPYALGPGAENLVVTVSMGISIATTPDRTYVDLYREADLALYRAKDAGRNQYALFDDELRARAESRMNAEALLRRALAEDSLIAHFQPLIDLAGGDIRGIEALARIRSDDGSLVLPAEFVTVAEETGLVVELDGRMFELAVAQYASLREKGLPVTRVGTNVSARSLEDCSFVERLRRALVWHDVPGDAVRIELTETSLLTESPVVADSIKRILDLGMRIGLDDFGTGYSALAYLGEFSLQFLKIDRSFVARLGRTDQDDALVAAVISLAKAYNLVVIGEGVETEEQISALRRLGCDWAQGYLVSRPVPAAELEALLRSDPRW